MKERPYLAHRAKDGREQTVLEHLTGTADLCGRFAAAFGAEEQGRLAGLAHDLGKYSKAFQRRLDGAPDRVDHSTAGAWECGKRGQIFAAFAVAGHHGGLPDGGGKGDTPDQPTFFGRMNRAAQSKLEPWDAWEKEVALPPAAVPAIPSQPEGMFFARMLYSCLVDADFLDTETFMDGGSVRDGGETMEVLERKLLDHISKWFPPKRPLDVQRCRLLERCLDQGAEQSPGLFTLTIPTGGGKTVSSLAFALRHARAHGLRRVVYVLPYTSIIEQNAGVFRDILGAENVLEHHSGVQYEMKEEADPQSIRMAKATENWDMPVVVTTAVQFFESLYSDHSSRCRKLHNLAGSVIIFDEAQMLPVPYLRPCVFAIAQLVKRYGVSAVLCTATQPALGPLFGEFLPDRKPVELCPQGTCQGEVFRRVTFRREGTLSQTQLAARLQDHSQVLCVVNSRKSAQAVYSLLEGEGNFHLSTLMCPAHRKAVLEEIRARLKKGLPCRVVSTSLIEAGVDVDFPAVFREEAGLDSILQAAGRCNREGKNASEDSVVTIFQGEAPPPLLFRQPIAAGRTVLSCFEQLDSSEAMDRYFRELLDLKGPEGQDQKKILPLMADPQTCMPFRAVAERFRLIETDTRTVYLPWGEGKELIQRLEQGERSRELFRSLGQYSVEVYPNHFQALDNAGALRYLEDASGVLTDTARYSKDTGLALGVEGGQAEFI